MRLSLFTALTACVFVLHAQIVDPKKVKYGKFSDAELELSAYAADPDAEAVVLFDRAVAGMIYNPTTDGLQLVTDHHARVKILKGSGVDYATFIFRLSSSNNSSAREEIVSIKGVTVNTVDGKTEETKLSKEGIFTERIADGLHRLTITFPQVREGSIIDLKYTYKSDYLMDVPTWYFQRGIPTDYSHYEASFPEYFLYSVDMKGYGGDRLTESQVASIGNGSLNIPGSNQPLQFVTRNYAWTAVEVPALRPEPHAPTVSNYFFRVDFELGSVNFPGRLGTNYTRTWDDIVDLYRRFAGNGNYLKPRKEVEALAADWSAGAEKATERTLLIYENVKHAIAWTGGYAISAEQMPGKLLELKTGNSGDINYLLISALRAAGVEAYPVLVSTRNNGYLSLTRPSLLQFNHVIVAAYPDGQPILLDATRTDVPLPLLPRHDLNDRGRLIRAESSEWVNLKAPAEDKAALQLQLALDEEGRLSGQAKYKASGYAALDLRRAYDTEDLQNFLGQWTGQRIGEVAVSGYDQIYEDITIEAEIDAADAIMNNGDLYYLNAIIARHYAENPFTAESRSFPVDLQVPRDYVYVLQLALPEGMSVEELPESANFSLPEGKGKYSLRFINLGDQLQVIEKLSLNEPFFFATEYAVLKKFFELVLENEEATVVLKKNS